MAQIFYRTRITDVSPFHNVFMFPQHIGPLIAGEVEQSRAPSSTERARLEHIPVVTELAIKTGTNANSTILNDEENLQHRLLVATGDCTMWGHAASALLIYVALREAN